MLSRFFNKGQPKSPPPPVPSPETEEQTVMLEGSQVEVPQVIDWQPGDIINDRYRVEAVFSGAMGKVYISEHLGWKIKMAIKAPRPEVLADQEGIKRILAEANGWIKLGLHPNIATCYYVRKINKVPYLFIEFVNGGTLDEWIKAGRCRDFRTALSLAVQFCNGMEYTHSKGIIHRDIKPQNILISKTGILKITDFGIIRSLDDKKKDKDTGDINKNGTAEDTVGFRGTPKYASPEQLKSAHDVDFRSDIFSFGVCLWLMFCHKRPYLKNAAGGELDPTPADPALVLPQSLKELLNKSVAYDKRDRYGDFAQLRAALNEVHLELFHVASPYALMPHFDLQAESFNNRAVSLAELGKIKQAGSLINRALDINDLLPEAISNFIILKWRTTQEKADRIQSLIAATKKRLPDNNLLDDLEIEVKKYIGDKGNKESRITPPQLLLCVPQSPMEIFQQGQLLQSIQQNVLDLLQNNKFADCYETLIKSWQHNHFTKDKIFNKTYERLLEKGRTVKAIAGQRIFTHPGFGQPVLLLGYLPTSRQIVSIGPDNRILLRQLGARKKVKLLARTSAKILSLATDSVGNSIAVGLDNGSIVIYSLQAGRQNVLQKKGEPVTSLAFSPDNKWLAAGNKSGAIKIYNPADGKSRELAALEGGAVDSLLIINSKLDMISGSEDGVIRLWMEGEKDFIRSIDAHVMPVQALSITPDGRLFASTSQDRMVRIWDQLTGLCKHSLTAHSDDITDVLLLEDGHSLISSSENDIIKVWDLKSGDQRLTLDGRGGGITCLCQGPRPHTFLAGRQDGAIVLWMVIYQLDFS
jgi:serine/threonine protein kinase